MAIWDIAVLIRNVEELSTFPTQPEQLGFHARHLAMQGLHKIFDASLLTITKERSYSLEECIEISRNMSRFLSNTHFDLPFVRYDQKICTRCEEGELMHCRIDCRRNRTNSIARSM